MEGAHLTGVVTADMQRGTNFFNHFLSGIFICPSGTFEISCKLKSFLLQKIPLQLSCSFHLSHKILSGSFLRAFISQLSEKERETTLDIISGKRLKYIRAYKIQGKFAGGSSEPEITPETPQSDLL